ncbi:peptide/nickel transport system ATP-binding protein [Halogeometricum rufum]|jgi:oligopeptide/dipeptide ABC transporter ATP-binding protein|uniref:Peptide/nickel transport system ATP-binding protein n=1 Tax=Halogeometricum rufum TaxID=553469 RepID=A0A1I6IPK4_9EURY|nr:MULTISPECIES: ABC transporter ATP-binding protein [Halogeometricum]MUV56054.1 ATP-binding cassette domain-containing protein [Halogeometricum sp. CBA1124]SFR68685.1 peptide/nickel transport system ATP-binding protein [Halogeometricum rufum]
MSSEPLLEVENLTIEYDTRQGPLTAVSNADFTVEDGEYFGLVGESGCGKSTLAKSIIGGLDDNGRIASGKLKYRGEELQDLGDAELNEKVRWKEIAYIPQASMNSLDPMQRLSEQALEIANVHTDLSEEEALAQFEEMFEVVGLPENRIRDYPHQFSGGMQQRAIIALALFLQPSIVIADEPTTALDVIMQDQIFKYLDEIRDSTETSMILITHDISLVFESCDELAVMHGGQIAETGPITDVYDDPKHPYSYLLQRAFPDIRFPDRELETIEGTPPQQFGDVDYCTFANRCPWAEEGCREAAPPLEASDTSADGHRAACFRTNEIFEQEDPAESLAAIRGDQS